MTSPRSSRAAACLICQPRRYPMSPRRISCRREIERLRNVVALNGGQRDLLALDDAELLTALGLASSRGLSLAAVLLLGNPAAIHRAAPAHEVIMLRMFGGAHMTCARTRAAPFWRCWKSSISGSNPISPSRRSTMGSTIARSPSSLISQPARRCSMRSSTATM